MGDRVSRRASHVRRVNECNDNDNVYDDKDSPRNENNNSVKHEAEVSIQDNTVQDDPD